MTKKLGIILGSVAVAGVALQFSTVNVHADKVTVGSVTSDADIWRHIAKSPAAKKADLQIKVKEFTDGATLNRATASGQVDVNAFQSYSYFLAFN
jgi:D-methionine transport system substrate-binding protein